MCHLSSTASSSSLMPGRAIVEQVLVAELGDARRLAGVGDLVVGLGARGVEHELVGRACACGSAAVRRLAICDGRKRRPAMPIELAPAASRPSAARMPSTTSSSPTHARIGAAFDRALGVPCRRDDRGPWRRRDAARPPPAPSDLKPREHHHRVRLLDEMRAVMQADEEIELLLPHAAADVGEAFVEVHASGLELLRADGIAEVGVLEQLLERPHLADHALLVHVALDGFEVLAVGGRQAVLPRIAAEQCPPAPRPRCAPRRAAPCAGSAPAGRPSASTPRTPSPGWSRPRDICRRSPA